MLLTMLLINLVNDIDADNVLEKIDSILMYWMAWRGSDAVIMAAYGYGFIRSF